MPIEYVFIDNGGVITDGTRRESQHRRLVGDYFVGRFGGSREAWEDANVGIFPGIWQRFLARVEGWHQGRDIKHEMSLYYGDWMRSMLSACGADGSMSDDECAAAGKEIDAWIGRQIDARFPGALEAIEALAPRFRLFTASDGFEASLAAALGPCAGRFERLYGPDLVNVPKSSGRAYYDAVFADAGVDPTRALVIDDGVSNLLAAQSAGARGVLVTAQDEPDYAGLRITRLAELPGIIETL